MLSNLLKGISPSVKIVSLILLILCLLMANSIYLITFMTILIVILMLIINEKVNIYVNTQKKFLILLLIMLVGYIIIFDKCSVLNIVLFLYKIILLCLLIKVFILNVDFKEIHEGIYGILIPLTKLNINVEKFSLDLILSAYFVKFLFISSKEIKKYEILSAKTKFSLKGKIFSRLIYSINRLSVFQDNLKIKLYKLNYRKVNIYSKFILILTIIFFIVCIFKEVIL